MKKSFLFTSESVSEGHPDKMADQISDAILDEMLKQDSDSRVACETMITTGMVVVSGEITTKATVDIQRLVRKTIQNIGFDASEKGFDFNTCAVLIAIDEQSPDISQGVTIGEGLYQEQGAGDQGLMFGYACRETKSLMPLPITLSHQLVQELAALRKSGELGYLRPDSKSQVTVEYVEGTPHRVDAIVIATQHDEGVEHKTIEKNIKEKLIQKVIPEKLLDKNTKIYINPTGRFVVGGPLGDCGLTGRKIIVDTYGGMGRHGGGAFSGKDPSKVDRSGAYAARYVAKNIVAAGFADRCEVQLAYAIGVAQPVSVNIDTFQTNTVEEDLIEKLVSEHFDLSPLGIIKHLNLKKPIYLRTAVYGHFGRSDRYFPWEKTDKVDILREAIGFKKKNDERTFVRILEQAKPVG